MAEEWVSCVIIPGHRLRWWMGLLLGMLLLTPHGKIWGQAPADLLKKPESGKAAAPGEKDKQIEELKRQLREKDAELAQLREKLKEQIEALKQQLQAVKGQYGEQSQQTEALKQQLRVKEKALVTPEQAVPAKEKTSPPTPREWRSPLGMDFVLMQAGSFAMGSSTGDEDEKPPHRVTISTAFYLGKYEVTQGQWQAVMGSNPRQFTGDPNLPVTNVSWDDVQAFIGKLNAREGGTRYRLHSEAQWEYAARAGSATAYSFGDNEQQLGQYAWYDANAGGKTHPVGQKLANAWGLHDMHGNVWEWVQDGRRDYTSAAVTDPVGPLSGSSRVFRGGGWYGGAGNCRSANRHSYAPGSRRANLGFRLLRTVP